jgi:hypothetical protein
MAPYPIKGLSPTWQLTYRKPFIYPDFNFHIRFLEYPWQYSHYCTSNVLNLSSWWSVVLTHESVLRVWVMESTWPMHWCDNDVLSAAEFQAWNGGIIRKKWLPNKEKESSMISQIRGMSSNPATFGTIAWKVCDRVRAKAKAVPLHAMKELVEVGGIIAPTHWPRH